MSTFPADPSRGAEPVPPIPRTGPGGEPLFCTKCGERNRENDFRCVRCGTLLHEDPSPRYVVVDEAAALGGLIPVRNPRALWAYYLGVFSLIPFLGIPLGIAAVVLGRAGVRFARENPEARGAGHGWAGIVLGSLSVIGYGLLIAAMAFGAC